MADMLSNALLNSGCFRVVDRQTIDDILQEQNFANSGRVNQNTAASIGNLTGAQLIVTGNVTEFKENESGGLVGGLINNAPGGMGMVKAHVGFIIQIIDANTGELLVSESIGRRHSRGQGWVRSSSRRWFFLKQGHGRCFGRSHNRCCSILGRATIKSPSATSS